MTAFNWTNYPATTQQLQPLFWSDEKIDFNSATSFLAYGAGRSYGDSCLNSQGILLDTSLLNHFLKFDAQHGVLQCEAGVTLAEILALIVPHGWLLPVVPGTKFITVGGAIANDVHGKNHHQQGTFGCHVKSLRLLRSDGQVYDCDQSHNTELFAATIGGLGLTGIILSADIQLQKIISSVVDVTQQSFANLTDYFTIAKHANEKFQYTAAWIDGQAKDKNLGRGVFFVANEAKNSILEWPVNTQWKIPVYFPSFCLNKWTMRWFCNRYYQQHTKSSSYQQHFDTFQFPLDKIAHWNRLYGKRGFLQYQCVVPTENDAAITEVMKKISACRLGSFLSVLKILGSRVSPGLLSFPMPGLTLALDFPNQGRKTLTLLDELDRIIMEAQGRVYPAKDARMSSAAFKAYYPAWEKFAKHIDPKFCSDFWRRVMND